MLKEQLRRDAKTRAKKSQKVFSVFNSNRTGSWECRSVGSVITWPAQSPGSVPSIAYPRQDDIHLLCVLRRLRQKDTKFKMLSSYTIHSN